MRVDHLGTVIHIFDQNSPMYETEFTDNEGCALVTVPLKKEDMSLYWVASTKKYSNESTRSLSTFRCTLIQSKIPYTSKSIGYSQTFKSSSGNHHLP
ncbi:DUF4926 domain-containing protein [Psychrobacter sp. DM4]|uniref:DUF4926 domain-containing protein n=1 Tax=Psychrobacter sp. DM4 TaxID=3440637 RepID=UPI003F4FCF5C